MRSGAAGPGAARRAGRAVLLAFLAWPAAAGAAPFCVVTQAVPPRCLYADAQSCDAEARREHGYCQANPDQVLPQRGGGQFCVTVGSAALDCGFRDRATCERAAGRAHAACLAAPVPPTSGPPDPFSLRRPS